ncbi:MAG TPA: thymidine phosphorylase [Candidatus Baltobacteraceae bacterium]|nr:thymidine phosphorylase [Candidatus Baltobacteraceae bacterium]
MDQQTMRACIERKREGGDLSPEEWTRIVAGLMDGRVDEAQFAALCMACVWRGMSFDEAFAMTRAMVESGDQLSFDRQEGVVVDKHSSGGVSDIVSLAAVPLAAACGARVAKLSGRALGHTGGTIDKLETIPGLRTALSTEEFAEQVRNTGCAIAAQSATIVPADKRIYALRDRTGTVPALGLISSSIVSKKIAGGAHAFVFDVKTGPAAFMQEPEKAKELGRWLLEIAARFGRRATAFVTDMSEPLGRCIGTGVEVVEAREMLQGNGDPRAVQLVTAIAAALVNECGFDEPEALVMRALSSGSGFEKFREMIAAQGGDVSAFENMQLGESIAVRARSGGYVSSIDVVRLGHAGRRLSTHDPLGGLRVDVRIGDYVETGTPLLHAYGRDRDHAAQFADAFTLSESKPAPVPLIYDVQINSVLYPQSGRAAAL